LHGDIVETGFTVLWLHAFTVGIFHESLLTETSFDALEGTERAWFRILAIGNTSGSASFELGIGTAFLINREGRDSQSKVE
jgi:hypothetical protein